MSFDKPSNKSVRRVEIFASVFSIAGIFLVCFWPGILSAVILGLGLIVFIVARFLE
jgi:hypothetical protein